MHEHDEVRFTKGGLTYDEVCRLMDDDRGYITYSKEGFRYDHPSRMARRPSWVEGWWVVQARKRTAALGRDNWETKWWTYDGKSIGGDSFEAAEADKAAADWIYTNDMPHDMVLLTPLCYDKVEFDIDELEEREAKAAEVRKKLLDAWAREASLREGLDRIYALLLGAAAGMWLYLFLLYHGVL